MEKVKKDEKRKEERRKDERRMRRMKEKCVASCKSNKNFIIKYSVFSSPCPICSIYLVWFR